MPKKVSLNIPKESYEELASLSEFYKQDIEQTILGILEVVGSSSHWITNLSKDYKMPIKPTTALTHMLDAATTSMVLFGEILEKLQAKGLFVLEDLSFDLDENSFTFSYSALNGSDLYIDSFYLALSPGLKSLTASCSLDVTKVSKKSLEKLKHVAEGFEAPAEFDELEQYYFEIEELDEELWTLFIQCEAEYMGDFPSIKQLSHAAEEILKKAGIRSRTE